MQKIHFAYSVEDQVHSKHLEVRSKVGKLKTEYYEHKIKVKTLVMH